MDTSTIRSKRARSLSSFSSSSAGSSIGESSFRSPSPPPPKYHKSKPNSDLTSTNDFLCVLPPTCSQPNTSTSYSTQDELDKHQSIFHKWICHIPIRDRDFTATTNKGKDKEIDNGLPESFIGGKHKDGKRWKECLKVFPDERLLDLHHTEVHDPIAREKKENGEKIFECFLDPSQCDKKSIDPKKRRRHMIDKHKYPPNYFFSITNHGINSIVQEDGLAISLIRPRKDPPNQPVIDTSSPQINRSNNDSHTPPHRVDLAQPHKTNMNEIDMDDLTSKMGKMESSLSFVPRGVRKANKAKEKVMDV